MRLAITILLIIGTSLCAVFQNPLVWKRSSKFEMMRNRQHSKYLRKLNVSEEPLGEPAKTNVEENDDYEFAQLVTIGTPGQEFLLWLSTYSSMVWVAHPNCTSESCLSYKKFYPRESETFIGSNMKWKTYSYGGTAGGFIGSDLIEIVGVNGSDLTVLRTPFGLATNVESRYKNVDFDGVLGLAYTANKETHSKPFIVWAINQAALDEPLFTVWLAHPTFERSEADGVITYGSVDYKHCGPVIGYAPFSSSSLYQYKIDAISMGYFKSNMQYQVVQELNGWITGPPSVITELAKVAGAQYNPDFSLYEVPCENGFPDLEITIGSVTYSIDHKNLKTKLTLNACTLMLKHGEPNSSTWYFGAPFIREYCTIFDIGEKQFRFAKANPEKDTTPPPSTKTSRFTKAASTTRDSAIPETTIMETTSLLSTRTNGGIGLIVYLQLFLVTQIVDVFVNVP